MDDAQHDFLSEILNIGLGKAGAALSEMSGARVTMEVPKMTVCPAEELPQHLAVFGDDEVLTVTQSFWEFSPAGWSLSCRPSAAVS